MKKATGIIPILRSHSYYAMGWGVRSPDALCRAAAERGYTHMAMADMNGLYGFVRFLDAARKHGIVPMAAVTLRFPDGELELISETRQGYTDLCRIISAYRSTGYRTLNGLREISSNPEILCLTRSARLLKQCIEWTGRKRTYLMISRQPVQEDAYIAARSSGIRTVIAPRIFALNAADQSTHVLQRAISLRTTWDNLPKRETWAERGLMVDQSEMRDLESGYPDAWRNTIEIAERCAVDWSFQKPILPRISSSEKEAADRLTQRVVSGAEQRYGNPDSHEVTSRIRQELDVIISRGLADYFLLVHDLVQYCPITCGRGSAASSIVSYCLGITHVDPVSSDLYFERFLGPGRTDIPDIDVDFPWDERPGVIETLFSMVPKNTIALVANHVTFRARAAVRETGRVFGMDERRLTELSRGLRRSMHGFESDGAPISEIVEHNPERFRGMERILSSAASLKGLPRHLSRHCGGIVMVPEGVDTVVPVETLPDGLTIIQWEKDQTEEAGLVKIDILGNRSLALVRDAIRHVNSSHGEKLDYRSLNPLTDGKTTELLARGDTMGIFYVESPAMRQLQCKAGTGDYESLVIHSSIIRPAANQWISEYIERIKSGDYPRIHPVFDELLSETKGILCYQEDVMRVAGELAGFNHADADRLRRILTKKNSIPLVEMAERFIAGLKESGLADDQARHVWEMMESFGGYSFCKAHSASYALVSFKAAYLKAHYAAEFMAALISNGGGYYTSQAYVSELRRMGLELLPPDINDAFAEFIPCDKAVRVGLGHIKGLGGDDIDRILTARSEYPITSLDDLWDRCSLSTSAVHGLILAGALDTIHGRGCRMHLLRELAGYTGRNPARQTLSLVHSPPRIYDDAPDEDYYRFQELDVLGFTLKGHPLDLIDLSEFESVDASELSRHIGSRITLPGWMVTTKPVRTKAGDDMAFVSFEDWHAIYETVLFPRAYGRYGEILRAGRPYVIHGEVTEEWGSITVNIERITPIPFSPPWKNDGQSYDDKGTYSGPQRGNARRTA